MSGRPTCSHAFGVRFTYGKATPKTVGRSSTAKGDREKANKMCVFLLAGCLVGQFESDQVKIWDLIKHTDE